MAAKKSFSVEAVFSALDKISAPISKIQGKLATLGTGAGAALKGANKAVDKGIAGFSKLGDAIGLGAVASVAGLGVVLKDTVSKGADFERTMVFAAAQFPGMIRQGTKEFDALQAAARKVGDETEFSSADAAEGLTLLATAGLSAEAAIAALPKVVNFATASKVEFAKASDIANNVLGAFSLTSEDAATNAANMSRVMDVMTRAAADSTTNVEELFEAIKSGGTVASGAGIKLEEFVGYTEALANVGYKGSEAGTALRGVLRELGAPTDTVKKHMAALGVSVAKTKSGSIDLTTTITRFAKATSKMTKAQRIATLGNIFGAHTMGPFMALMDAGADKINGYRKSLEGAAGTTEGMAKLLSADMLGSLRNFSSLLEGVQLDVFAAIEPIVRELVAATSAWVTENRELIKTKAAEWLTTVKDNLPAIWSWLKKIAEIIAVLAAFAAVVKTINAIATVVGWLATAWGFLNAALAFFAGELLVAAPLIAATIGPILLIGAAVAAVVVLVWKFWPEISSFFSKLAAFAIAAFQRFWAAAVSIFTRFKSFVIGVFEFLVGVQLLIWKPIVAFFAALWESVKPIFVAVGNWIVARALSIYGLFLQIWTPIVSFYASIWELVKTGFGLLWIGIVAIAKAHYELFLAVWRPIVGFFVALWNGVVEAFRTIVGPIIDSISGFIGKVRSIGATALGTGGTETTGPGAPPPQVVSPQARAAAEGAEANANASVNGTITVAPAPGATASVAAKPNSLPLRVQPSGAF